MADAYIRTRKFPLAIEALQTVLELAQPEELIFEAIGHCHDKMGEYNNARTYYRKALHLNPEDSMLFYKIATTYMSQHEWQKAISHLKTALRLSKNQPDFNLAMGQCLVQLGQYEDAIQYLGTVIRLKPKNLSGWVTLLQCLYRGGYHKEGIRAIAAEMQRPRTKPVFHFYLAAFLFATGKTKEARLQLEQGMAINPRLVKKMKELDPAILLNPHILDVIARTGKKS
jgi:tetratricopeptide (TPR) repeat protein